MNIIERLVINYIYKKAWNDTVKHYNEYYKNKNSSLDINDQKDEMISIFNDKLDNNTNDSYEEPKLSLKRKK